MLVRVLVLLSVDEIVLLSVGELVLLGVTVVTDLVVLGDEELWRGRLGVSGDLRGGDPNTGVDLTGITVVRRVRKALNAGFWRDLSDFLRGRTCGLRTQRFRSGTRIRIGVFLPLVSPEFPSSGLGRRKDSLELLVRGIDDVPEEILETFVLGVEIEFLSQL